MHASDSHGDSEAWYRNRMVWLVIAIPGLTIAGCIFTIYLALTNPDTLVRDVPDSVSLSAQPSRE